MHLNILHAFALFIMLYFIVLHFFNFFFVLVLFLSPYLKSRIILISAPTYFFMFSLDSH